MLCAAKWVFESAFVVSEIVEENAGVWPGFVGTGRQSDDIAMGCCPCPEQTFRLSAGAALDSQR